MTANEYAQKIVLDFLRKITDYVFLSIQNDEERMREYQRQVNEHSLNSVNASIAKKVKEIFDLEDEAKCDTPRSWLIQGFMTFRKK